MWDEAYGAARKYLKHGPWYVQSHMRTGRMVHEQFESLQAFWPALQVLAGDVDDAIETHDAFFSLWTQFGFLPESFLLASRTVHPSMKYYPLRPELAESTYALYRATRDPYYLQQGAQMLKSLNGAPRVPGGFASVKDVKNPRVLEDRMASFFLAETCKYLFLLFDDDNFVHADPNRSLIFNTEGHLIPVQPRLHTNHSDDAAAENKSLWEKAAQAVAGAADAIKAAVPRTGKAAAGGAGQTDRRSCPNTGSLEQIAADEFVGHRDSWLPLQRRRAKPPPETSAAAANQNVCAAQGSEQHKRQQQQQRNSNSNSNNNKNSNSNVLQVQGVEVQAGDGVFKLREEQGEAMVFRVMPNVGVEMSHSDGNSAGWFYLFRPMTTPSRQSAGAPATTSGASGTTPAEPAEVKSVATLGTGIEMSVTGFYVKLVTPSASASSGGKSGSSSSSTTTSTHTFPASNAMFGPQVTSFAAEGQPLISASPVDGCSPSPRQGKAGSSPQSTAAAVPAAGSVVLVERGSCAFVSKVYAAQESGASAVIVVNTQRAELFMMGGDGTARQGKIRIPAVMVSAESGKAIRAILRAQAAKGNSGSSSNPVLATFGEHQFELTAPDEEGLKANGGVGGGGDVVARGLGLRPPLAWGSCTDFFFHGMKDWGIQVNRLADGNYQLMLVGQRVCAHACIPAAPLLLPCRSLAAPSPSQLD